MHTLKMMHEMLKINFSGLELLVISHLKNTLGESFQSKNKPRRCF